MKLKLKDNLNFSKLSKDRNKIHIDENFAKNYFIKKTISHGANLVLKMISLYLRKYTKNQLQKIEVRFMRPTFTNQEFNIIATKNKIFLNSNKENNIKITLKTKSNLSNKLYFLKKLILEISKTVGNHQKKPSLILTTNILNKKNCKAKKNLLKVKKNIYKLTLSNRFYQSETLFVKLVEREKIKFLSKRKFKNKNKRVLIFGKNSDLARYTASYLDSLGYKIEFYPNYYFEKKNIRKDKILIENFFKKNFFNYIFYYISPKIETYKKKNYNFLYLKIFKIIYNQIKNSNTKIFYPSTNFINIGNDAFNYYIDAKKKAEKWIIKNDKKSLIKIYRLPQIKTSQTYNLLGFFDGLNISVLKSKVKSFLN